MNHTVTPSDTNTSVKSNQSKALAPKLRFKFFNDQWIKMNYGDIYSFYSTNSYSRDNLNYESGAVKNIHYGDIHTKFKTLFDIQKEEVPFINSVIDINKIKEECFCKEKDLIIADASEDYADIGKTIELININNEKIIAGLHTFLARPNKHEMAKGFAGYLVQTWHFRKQVMTIAQGTKVLSISTGRLANLKLHLPTLPEQQKIAAFLSAVDEKIQLLTRKKELLTQYKKGVMQQLFSGKLRFKDEQGKDFPEWEKLRLGEFMKVRNSQSPKNINYPLMAFIQHIGVAPKGDRYNREFLVNDEGNKKYKRTEYGDFIYSSNNLETGSIGLNRYGAASISPVYSIFQVNNTCDFNFLSEYFIRKEFISKMIRFRQGVVYGQWRIHESEFLKIEERIPCLNEQKKIAVFLSNIDSRIESLSSQISQTQTFKKGLLQQMFV